jgi:hypothetical protein
VSQGPLVAGRSAASSRALREPTRAFGCASQDPDVPVAHGRRGSPGDVGLTGSATSTAIGSSGSGSLKSKSRYPSVSRADETDWSA